MRAGGFGAMGPADALRSQLTFREQRKHEVSPWHHGGSGVGRASGSPRGAQPPAPGPSTRVRSPGGDQGEPHCSGEEAGPGTRGRDPRPRPEGGTAGCHCPGPPNAEATLSGFPGAQPSRHHLLESSLTTCLMIHSGRFSNSAHSSASSSLSLSTNSHKIARDVCWSYLF